MMQQFPYQHVPPPPWMPMLPPNPPASSAFWETKNVRERLKDLQETIDLAMSMQKELELLNMIKETKGCEEDEGVGLEETSLCHFFEYLKDYKIDLGSQELLSVEAVNSLISKLRFQLEPFRVITDERSPWEEKSASARLASKREKCKRNKGWRKRKRKWIAEICAKERGRFDLADQEADEWRAREIAKDIAKRKVEKMKEIAKIKAKEEKNRLQSELEQVLIVEKLQELRSIRIEKLKKQGHFFPEEDDKFLERVRAAVEEEERLVMAAADTDAAKDAIATAVESRKVIQGLVPDTIDLSSNKEEDKESQNQINQGDSKKDSKSVTTEEPGKQGLEGQSYGGAYDSLADLPVEFYHYYHGSNTDMGTLIEVRRTWDAYIRPGGSRIPGHWVQPPLPADKTWASYLMRPK